MNIKHLLLLSLILPLLLPSPVSSEIRIRCASTTSLENSGFFDYILPIFEKKKGIKIDIIAVGTGAAIEIGKRGDADIVFVHAKEQELKAVEEGYFVERHDVMHNDFVIIGPSDDPLKIKGITSVAEAFKSIAGSAYPFISRGDRSGTHTKELSIWKTTGIVPKGHGWYLEVGQGMEKTQRIANEKRAYTLTDRGTWLATKDKDRLDMKILLEGDNFLLNQYGIMVVNPERHRHVRYTAAMEFVKWITSKEGKEAISAFKDKNNTPLFIPDYI